MVDDDLMPFGKYKGRKLVDIPASYFHYLWFNGIKNETDHKLHSYIRDNIHLFEIENPDLIWDD